MIQVSRRLFYAVEAVLYIAYNGASEPISSKEIAAKQGMPPRYLEQMMQLLARDGILRGVRGPRGGYLLAREKRRVTLADICHALGDEDEPRTSTPLGNDVLFPALLKLKDGLTEQLKQITLATLYDQASDRQIRKRDEERNDFTI